MFTSIPFFSKRLKRYATEDSDEIVRLREELNELKKQLSDFFSRLNSPGMLAIGSATVDNSPVGSRTASTGSFTSLVTTLHSGIGTQSPGVQTYSGFTNLTVSGSTKAGIVEIITQEADADAVNVGSVRWTDKNSSAGDKTLAAVQTSLQGTTGNNRGAKLRFWTKADNGSLAERFFLDNVGNSVFGTAAIATNATDGFVYVPSCAGAPTGVPTSYTGRIPLVYDSSNDRLYAYNGGWKSTALA